MAVYKKTPNDFQACDYCKGPIYQKTETINSSADIYNLFSELRGKNRESFHVLSLNSRNRILDNSKVAVGSVNTVHISPVEVLKTALIKEAVSIICVHNHPSGDCSPSPEDRRLTERLARACSLMGIRFLDSMIIAAVGYYSFSDSGEL